MRLLVSVRDPDEVGQALAGGADIVDAKDPDSGPLGPVPLPRLRAIAARVPAGVPFSLALGDPRGGPEVVRAIESLATLPGPGPAFCKIGFLGAREADAAALLEAAVAAARSLPAPAGVVAVAYADADGAAPRPEAILDCAARAGARGVLLDTVRKDGGTLLDRFGAGELGAWVARVRGEGLLAAVAGRLRAEHIPPVAQTGADVVGIRGAGCAGDRGSRLVARKVRSVRIALDRALAGAGHQG